MTGLLSPGHTVVLILILLLVFGAKRLPELGRSLGSGMREFRRSIGGEAPDEHDGAPPAIAQAEDPTPPEHRTAA
jgi:sec-independent protein translocase protein TatA